MLEKHKNKWMMPLLMLLPIVSFLVCLSIGRYPVYIDEFLAALWAQLRGAEMTTAQLALIRVRLPRNIMAMLVGAALSLSGAVFQGLFKNPTVSPDLLGASSGASFGAAFAIFIGSSTVGIQLYSFAGGIVAVLLVALMNHVVSSRSRSIVNLILCGMLISSLFDAFVSFIKFVVDTDAKLPAITFWLMGSLSATTLSNLSVFWIFLPLCLLLLLLRWKINLLSLGDDEARMLGVHVSLYRGVMIACATLLTSLSVSVSGKIGWVGLLVPHLARMLVGTDYGKVLPASVLIGSSFMLIVDTVARMLYSVEIPLSIITAIIGAPFFFLLLLRSKKGFVS